MAFKCLAACSYVVDPISLKLPAKSKGGTPHAGLLMVPAAVDCVSGKWAKVCIQWTYTITPKGQSTGTPAFNCQHFQQHVSNGAQTKA